MGLITPITSIRRWLAEEDLSYLVEPERVDRSSVAGGPWGLRRDR